ncbi:aromatic ring-hydroxylating dioxygenase subunit alpha [Dyella sp.]|jgi:choline monooxygenase|uniref:aromatic ring-hydroxylating oxygenase subunit alpha n=1 Tax=Dyella sp. TaxID=1869338 RepID=UPI002D7699C1|nr:aromatic ring-hydroxylating dioxygenase subunit alpha [Dyella sp.]HET6432747.1 aromatic ring-hydroxylating dioxygenase subunit alpha [Dyella sp.]
MTDLLSPDTLAPQPLDHAHALDARYYVDPRMAAIDAAAVFAKSWQLVCHQSEIAGVGDHRVTAIAGLPLLVVRSDADTIRAFHNVCRHRAGPVASCDGKGATGLRCRYHGWTYGLDGVLRGAPEMGRTPDFDPSQIRLPEVRVQVWQGLVFVATGDAPPFEEFVRGIDARLGAARGMGEFVFHHRASWEVACNWKVYVDNYLEGYHVPHIHPGLNSVLDYRSYITETAQWYSFQFSPLESGDDLYGSGEALYYFLYPNTMLNILPGRLQTNRVLPLGVDRCRVEFDFYYAPDTSEAAMTRRVRDVAFSDEVQEEDVTICEDVQRGLASGSYTAGRLNPLRENAVHHFHEILRGAYRGASGTGA